MTSTQIDLRPPPRFGVVARSSDTTWADLLRVARRADELGFDSLWTNDHLVPINGDAQDAAFEAWTVISAWAQSTEHVRVGVLVSSNTFRSPALLTKMAVTLDHISNGRVTLGIGAGWFEDEHLAYGIPFGRSPGERLRWLAEALPIVRDMLGGGQPSATGRYAVRSPANRPLPIQPRVPILVGGDGEHVTLRLVAQYGDACNLTVALGIEALRHKLRVLEAHCRDVGRAPEDIERTVEFSSVIVRDSREAAIARHREVGGDLWAGPSPKSGVGTPDELVTTLAQLSALGFQHFLSV